MKVFISDDSKVIKVSLVDMISEFEEINIAAQAQSTNESIKSLC